MADLFVQLPGNPLKFHGLLNINGLMIQLEEWIALIQTGCWNGFLCMILERSLKARQLESASRHFHSYY